jgi:3-hydroxyisobutyrate dehydrogenase-like beta-hydroxyacid dehydrogenase
MFHRTLGRLNRKSYHLQRYLSNAAQKIGFIGLGNMGLSMAKNILANEHTGKKCGVIVYDINQNAVKTLVALGAQVCGVVALANLLMIYCTRNDVIQALFAYNERRM